MYAFVIAPDDGWAAFRRPADSIAADIASHAGASIAPVTVPSVFWNRGAVAASTALAPFAVAASLSPGTYVVLAWNAASWFATTACMPATVPLTTAFTTSGWAVAYARVVTRQMLTSGTGPIA